MNKASQPKPTREQCIAEAAAVFAASCDRMDLEAIAVARAMDSRPATS